MEETFNLGQERKIDPFLPNVCLVEIIFKSAVFSNLQIYASKCKHKTTR